MIDTIKLMIEMNSVKILNPEYFTPNFNISKLPLGQVSSDGFFECNQFIPPENIRKSSLHKIFYFPRLKIQRINTRGKLDNEGNKVPQILHFLKIEFSIPKLLFKNNFEEVTTGDIEKIMETLIERLIQMGVLVTREAILHSKVLGVHFGKNVLIDDYASCYPLLQSIAKADITSRLELGQIEYRNDGHLVRFRADSYELCFYDKVKDLETAINKAKSRSMEEDNDIQKEMIEKLKGKQILRMEFRFNNMEKYKDICGKIGIKKTKEYFEDLYDLETAKKICNYYWDIVANSVSNVSLGVSNMKIIFEHLAYKEELSKSKVLSIMGAFCINELFGNRFLKTYSRKKHSDIKMLSERINLTTTYTAGVIKRIKGELEQFKPIRFEEWENAEKAIQEARKPIDLNKINIFN